MAAGAPVVFRAATSQRGRSQTKGKAEEAMATAEVTIEGTYSVPLITHVCLEPHGLTAKWEAGDTPANDKSVAWASTQSVMAVASDLAGAMEIPASNVTVLTDYMGGGFGSKFGADIWGRTAAQLSKQAGARPVKMFLDRVQEHLAAGNRPSGSAHIKIGANRDGKLVAMIADAHGTGGVGGGADVILPYVYSVPNTARDAIDASGPTSAAREPCGPRGILKSCALTEAAMDDLADKLGMDPLEFRLKNLAPSRFPYAHLRGRAQDRGRADRLAREAQAARPERQPGRSSAAWAWPCTSGAAAAPRTRRSPARSTPTARSSSRPPPRTSAPGPGPILAIIAAEVLGLQADRHHLEYRQLDLPARSGFGRLDHDAVDGTADPRCRRPRPATRSSRRSRRPSRPQPADLSLKDGQLWVAGEPVMSLERRLPQAGHDHDLRDRFRYQEGLSSTGVGGCQFAEVAVDIETGVVKVKKIVAIQDSGLIIDKLTWESQIYGGVIGGLNYGLFEERLVDPTTGTMLNPDMEMYKLAGAADIPEIIVRAYEPPEQKARGVIGVGEPPTISTAAAIGNAVTNAIGVRVPEWPMSPRNVLNALATASKEGKA